MAAHSNATSSSNTSGDIFRAEVECDNRIRGFYQALRARKCSVQCDGAATAALPSRASS